MCAGEDVVLMHGKLGLEIVFSTPLA